MIKRSKAVQYLLAAELGILSLGAVSHLQAEDVVLDDFSSGITAINHPEGSGQSGVWYDAANNTFSTVSAGLQNGSDALIFGDGGFGNGIYIIYDAVVPADGDYQVSVDLDIDESGSPTGFSSLQVGVAVGADAQHRGLNPSALPGLTNFGSYAGLTSGDDSGNAVQTVTTNTFTASAGDSVLIAISTDVTSGSWSSGSSLWSGNTISVDNITLEDLNSDPPGPVPDEIIVDDFSSGVIATNSPSGGGNYQTWYDATPSTFGTPSGSTLDGSPAMQIVDGGFANGVYAIYPAVFPSDGTYTVEIAMDVDESSGGVNGIRGYQLGVATGADAVHRDPSGNLPGLNITGTYIGLTPNDDTSNATQVVLTAEFTATAGDDLLIALGTDVESGSWNANSSLWSGALMRVDDIIVRGVEVEPPPIEIVLDNDDGPSVYSSTGFSTSGATGYNGGTYQFAATGSSSTATWTGTIPEEGFYEISSIFRAGSNRASVASYDITTDEGTFTVTTDQRTNDLAFAFLGEYQLQPGPISITLNASESEPTTGGTVIIADAVRIRELDGPPPIDDPEVRIANILVFDGLDDVGTIQSYVNQIVRSHYNAIAVHARYRGDATYVPNKFDDTFTNNEPRNTLVGNVDVIQEFVDRGHAAGLKVFAYVNTNLVTDGSDTDPRPNHVVNTNPDWATYYYNGGNPIPQTTATEIDGIWLDPALPEVRAYNAGIVGDIVMNYDVDGVVIDRQRYPDTRFDRLEADYGYHPDAIAQFNLEYGKSGIPDPFDQDWWQFRRDQNTRAITDIYSTVNAIDPDALVLSYPIGRFTDAQDFLYQDWTAWLDNEVMDIVIPQIYTSSNATFSASAAEHLNAYTGDRALAVALDTFRPGNDLVGQIEISRTLGFVGQSLFTHTGAASLGYLDVLPNAWEGIAPFPEFSWKSEEFECQGLDIIGSDIDDVLIGTLCDELIIGGSGNDEIIASGGDDMILPDNAPGDDVIDGGEGNDTVDYSQAIYPIYVDLSAGIATSSKGENSIGNDTLTGIENIIGRVGEHDVYIGNDDDNIIYGEGIDETPVLDIHGDTIEGRGGNDLLHAGGPGYGGDQLVIRGGDGDDTIHASDGQNQELYGDAGNDTIYGYGGRDIIEGGAGDDVIDGGAAGEDNRAVFSGPASDYTVCEKSDGTIVVTDNVGTDGTDTLTNINRLVFSDKTYKAADFAKKLPNYTNCD